MKNLLGIAACIIVAKLIFATTFTSLQMTIIMRLIGMYIGYMGSLAFFMSFIVSCEY